jgi:hypothetical protein
VKRRPFLALALTLGVLAVAGYLAVVAHPVDRLAFLGGRRPVQSGVLPGVVTLPPTPESGVMREFRLYCWEQPFEAVRAAAAAELPGQGYRLKHRSRHQDLWWRADGAGIDLQARKCRKLADSSVANEDAAWTTVFIGARAPNTVLNRVRMIFAPRED